jgi:hypothetical protein
VDGWIPGFISLHKNWWGVSEYEEEARMDGLDVHSGMWTGQHEGLSI